MKKAHNYFSQPIPFFSILKSNIVQLEKSGLSHIIHRKGQYCAISEQVYGTNK